jgi:glycosyltransferase involved in cell wall biosynthesis
MSGNITIIIPAKNEARSIADVIRAASSLGPVVLVDSGSTDETCENARDAGAKVLQFAWNGQFPKKRNWVLRNHTFTTEWVLFLDADEYASDAFVTELEATLPNTPHNGFWLNYENHFLGKKLRGGDPFRKLALFRVGKGEYERIEEDSWSTLDMEIHEHPIVEGSVGEIKTPIQHNDYRGLKHYITKHNEYSDWEARRYMALTKAGQEKWAELTPRQQKKYKNITKGWLAPAYFLSCFFLKKGFLDGATGFHFALMKAIYFYQIRLKIKELDCKEKGMPI